MSSNHLLSVRGLSCLKDDGTPIFQDVSFDIDKGIYCLTGKSGSGKSTLLKCLAHLNVYQGEILFHGQTPVKHGWLLIVGQTFVAGIPKYRTKVLYVPQRPSLLPGTPRAFLETVQSFSSRQCNSDREATHENPIDLAHSWGVPSDVWDRAWSTLSGGEAQRISLAIGIGIPGAEIILLDEPTSALDEETSRTVEDSLTDLINSESSIHALVWITHSSAQEQRVAMRSISLSNGRLSSEGNGASENV